jgi:hypothetical protein
VKVFGVRMAGRKRLPCLVESSPHPFSLLTLIHQDRVPPTPSTSSSSRLIKENIPGIHTVPPFSLLTLIHQDRVPPTPSTFSVTADYLLTMLRLKLL